VDFNYFLNPDSDNISERKTSEGNFSPSNSISNNTPSKTVIQQKYLYGIVVVIIVLSIGGILAYKLIGERKIERSKQLAELREKAIADSIRVSDSLAMVQAEQLRIADSIARVELERQRMDESSGILKVYVPECICTPTTTIILLYIKSDSIYGIQYDGGDSDEECKICWEPNGCFIGKKTMEGKVTGFYYSFDSKDTPVKFTMKLGDGTCVEQKDYDVNNKFRTSKEFVFTENRDNEGFVQKDFGLFTSSINP